MAGWLESLTSSKCILPCFCSLCVNKQKVCFSPSAHTPRVSAAPLQSQAHTAPCVEAEKWGGGGASFTNQPVLPTTDAQTSYWKKLKRHTQAITALIVIDPKTNCGYRPAPSAGSSKEVGLQNCPQS